MAPALPWLLPALVAGLATILLTRRWAQVVAGILWGAVIVLVLLVLLALFYRRAATLTAGEVDALHAAIALMT